MDGCTDLYELQRGHINVQRYRDDLLEPIVRLYPGAVGENIQGRTGPPGDREVSRWADRPKKKRKTKTKNLG